jgi:hypothetical protein
VPLQILWFKLVIGICQLSCCEFLNQSENCVNNTPGNIEILNHSNFKNCSIWSTFGGMQWFYSRIYFFQCKRLHFCARMLLNHLQNRHNPCSVDATGAITSYEGVWWDRDCRTKIEGEYWFNTCANTHPHLILELTCEPVYEQKKSSQHIS